MGQGTSQERRGRCTGIIIMCIHNSSHPARIIANNRERRGRNSCIIIIRMRPIRDNVPYTYRTHCKATATATVSTEREEEVAVVLLSFL